MILKNFSFTLMVLTIVSCDQPQPPASKVAAALAEPIRYDAEVFYKSRVYLLSRRFAWSKDDTNLLLGSDASGIFNAYSLNINSKKIRPLTNSTTDSIFPVSFFPEDARLFYSSDKGGNEQNHLYVLEPSGNSIDLTPGEKVKAIFAGWDQTNESFYVTTNERDPKAFDLYRYQTDDYSRELIFQNDGDWIIAGGDRGRYLALVKNHSNVDSDIYLIDLQSNDPAPKLVTAHVGNVSHGVYTFTPDRQHMIYSTNEFGEFVQAWSYELATGDKSPLITSEWDISGLAYSLSGHYRGSFVNNDATTIMTLLDQESGEELLFPELPQGNVFSVRFSQDEKKIAFMIDTDTSPADVYVADIASGKVDRLTNALNPAIDEGLLVESEVVRYESFDGLKIPGILYRPTEASATNPVAALIWVHGGPGGQNRRGYNAMLQHLTNQGFAVLAANNRGSSGYGKTFFHLDDKRHGEVDLDDIVYGKHYLADLDWVDKTRIGIIGGSYGGYMVGAALAFRPDEFNVGVNIFGVMNWVRTLKSIPAWWGANRKSLYDELGDPATDEERLRRISPLFHAKNISVPLLVVQGANDPRVLQVESDEIVAAVRANEVPVEYLLFDDEGHGFTKRDNRIESSNTWVNFLNTHLKGATPEN
jgi:dipeptidyl aminopeptidase/acylaminoacyl peptidase